MKSRAYLSNLSPLWPFARQEAMLAAALPGWPKGAAIYKDELPAAHRQGHSVAALTGRAGLLRASTRGKSAETIYVASLAVLAWSAADLMVCLTGALARGATVVALDAGLTIPPMEGADVLHKAALAFAAGRKRADAREATKLGAAVSAANRRARTDYGIERIRGRWPLPSDEYPTALLIAEAGLSRNTIQDRLGKRPEAQRQHAAAQARKAKRNG